MKRFIALILIVGLLMLGGCTSEWYAHDTVYKTNDHMVFSWWGYDNPTNEDLKQSTEEGWWGEEIPYIPAD